MKIKKGGKILFTKADIAAMLFVSRGVLKVACESLKIELIDWKNKSQRFTEDQVFQIIKTLRKRLTDTEIDALIRQNAGF